MVHNEKPNVILFALTGFGNPVLKSLLGDARVNVSAVFTVKYDQPFPYYEEQQLHEFCSERQIACYCGVRVSSSEGITLLRQHAPDLIVVATFKQILKKNVLSLPTLGVVNFHPSLLPSYRGACPTNAALYNNESITGVTVHYVKEGLDDGDILLQRSIPIQVGDYDGLLRQKLANLSGELVPELVEMFVGSAKPVGTPQDHSQASFAPKPPVESGFLDGIHSALPTSIDTIRNKMRAFNPIPGTSILIGDRRVPVDRFELFHARRPDGIYDGNDTIDVVIHGQAIRLYKSIKQ